MDARLVLSGGKLGLKCWAPRCHRQAKRWYGWNANHGQDVPPRNVKAPLCAVHARELKGRVPVVPLGLVKKA